jgi:hypothetical protein
MFESRQHPLASPHVFLWRVIRFVCVAATVALSALALGVLGYHYIAAFGWLDSLLNASMILGGMGPVGSLETDAAKLFASFYALFSGLVFITVMGIVLAPVAHRVLHVFHLDTERDLEDSTPRSDQARDREP